MADLLAQQPLLAYVAVALLGLIVGSFLNVVILRLPRMMEAQWRAGAAEILGQPADAEALGGGLRATGCRRPLAGGASHRLGPLLQGPGSTPREDCVTTSNFLSYLRENGKFSASSVSIDGRT